MTHFFIVLLDALRANIMDVLFTFLCSFLLSYFILPRIALISFKKHLFDLPDSRKVHEGLISRLGGVAFFPCIIIAVFLVIAFRILGDKNEMLDTNSTSRLLMLSCSLFLLYLMGIMDDLIGVRYRSKFIIQILCSILIVLSGIYFDNFYGILGIYALPDSVGMPFTVFVIVLIMNAINLIDGIDGLASGLSIMTCLFLSILFIYLRWWMYAFIAIATLGTLIPFFYYNVFGRAEHRQKIFMGDTGSLSIGMLLSVLTVRLCMFDSLKEELLSNSIVIAFSFLIVPVFDVVRVIIHRLRIGKDPFLPDKNHIHHKFLALGYSSHKTLIIILFVSFSYSFLNLIAVNYIPITYLLLSDILLWTAMQILLTYRVNKKISNNNVNQEV